MPLSSVLGAQSITKPGVCTSTTRPSSPFDGQVIYETDTDRTLVWNNSAWVAVSYAVYTSSTRPSSPYTGQLIFETDTSRLAVWTGSAWQYETAAAGPPGLVYITGASFSSQTTVAFANSVFSSTYDNYIVQLNINAGTRTTFTMQVRDNSGTKNTAAYYGAWQGLGQNGTGGSATTNAATSFNMPQIEAAPYNSFAITVNTPADSAKQTSFHGTAVAMVTTAGLGNINFGGTYYVNEAHTGLVFTFGAASTGSYRVFGYANS